MRFRNTALTEDRAADARLVLPPRDPDRQIVDLLAADLDGDGRAELVVVDEDEAEPGRRSYAAFGVRAPNRR